MKADWFQEAYELLEGPENRYLREIAKLGCGT